MDNGESLSSRLLLLTDDDRLADALSRQFVRLGYGLRGVATCCEQALEMVPRLDVALVLLDCRLPGFATGLETARVLWDCLSVPVVFVLDRADRAILSRIGHVGARGCLVRPFDDAHVVSILEIALQQLQRERRLISSAHWMTVTLDNLDEGLILTDADGCIRRLNPMAEKLLGVEREAVLDHPLDSVYRVESGAAVADGGGRREGRLVRANGGDVLVEQTVTPMLDAGGSLRGTMVVFRDIGQRRRDEQALRQSVDNLQRTLEQAVNALAVTSEKRDPFTAGHQERVARLAEAMALEMGLSAERREGIRIAGLVHDIGKIHVPSEILAKPALLTDLEWGIVRGHCTVGHEILKDVPFPWPVARMVLEHHERLDGTGYPDGLTGGATLLESRILAVADVVEAMTSHRPYRAALGLDEALAEIRQGCGVRYDADVVEACLRLSENNRIPW